MPVKNINSTGSGNPSISVAKTGHIIIVRAYCLTTNVAHVAGDKWEFQAGGSNISGPLMAYVALPLSDETSKPDGLFKTSDDTENLTLNITAPGGQSTGGFVVYDYRPVQS